LRSRKPPFLWLVEKEWRELLSSHAFWVLLFVAGPLIGVSFISAVRTYAELSSYGGTADGVGEAFSPLVGVWAPTFSACELAAAFLLPFVAIRVMAGDRQSGALKLELQQPLSAWWRVVAKTLVLGAAWIIASGPAAVAIFLWRSYGGAVYAPELGSVIFGHMLNAGWTIAMALAAASLTDHPSTAAIVTLSVTIGTWIVNFIAAVQGGVWERLAGYTPTAIVAEFQHGLVRLDVVLIALAVTALGLAAAAIGVRTGAAIRTRVSESVVVAALTAAAVFGCTFLTSSWDLSENRMNSFPRADETLLRQIREPLQIEAHLAAVDPRRVDLEHKVLSKLRRVMPRVEVRYVAATSTGLFEQGAAQYGEVWYRLGDSGVPIMSRQTTADGVLGTIYGLAGFATPVETADIFRGHPLAVPPRRAAAMFYGVWPALVIAAGVRHWRRRS
jgi:ABC-type transport system involved in multi-copper enzyme maturation permease subunit